jgi:CRP-like cAMP-binding protein
LYITQLILCYLLSIIYLLSRSKQLIKDAIHDNDFLKNLDSTQVREIVDCMYEKRIKQGHYIIREGDAGQHLYVSAGRFKLTYIHTVSVT